MTSSFNSRAVTRQVEAGCSAVCVTCETQIKFTAKMRRWQVIANVYDNGVWERVEHYHAECYEEAGNPYGIAAA